MQENDVEIQAVKIEVHTNAGTGATSEDTLPVKKDSVSDTENLPSLSTLPQQPPISTEQNNDEGLVRAAIKVVLPFRYFDLWSSEGRHEYVDFVVEGRVGSILSCLPFILMIAISQAHASLALWLAFAFCSVSVAFQFYHGTYTPNSPLLYWFNAASWITYLVLGIIYELDPYNPTLIRNVTISSLAVAVTLSMLARSPFTMQYARAKVSEEVAASPDFLKFNMYLSGFWLLLFAVMAACAWGSYPLVNGSAGNVILGTVIPILVVVVGFVLSPYVVEYLKAKGSSVDTSQL